MSMTRVCVAFLLLTLMASMATAQNQQRANPAFTDPEVDANLPNVLLIGYSISIGYHLAAREALAGKANVYRPKTNCGPTTRGLEQIDQWLGDRTWDVVHWNFGLHDLKYMGPGGENLADPADPSSHPQVALDDYKANVAELAERIKKQGKVVIWRETTPVPKGAAGRVPGDASRYNAAAELLHSLLGCRPTLPRLQEPLAGLP